MRSIIEHYKFGENGVASVQQGFAVIVDDMEKIWFDQLLLGFCADVVNILIVLNVAVPVTICNGCTIHGIRLLAAARKRCGTFFRGRCGHRLK